MSTRRASWAWAGLLPFIAFALLFMIVPASSIVCRGDRSVNPAWVRTAARDRLGTEAVEIEGGHSPFLSRPAELAALIDSLL